ncbi:hypothetical protein NL676_034456 [Syzygium grande]|nr:hypothetical protein NL676_034456 [Syzygium grande]
MQRTSNVFIMKVSGCVPNGKVQPLRTSYSRGNQRLLHLRDLRRSSDATRAVEALDQSAAQHFCARKLSSPWQDQPETNFPRGLS